MKKYNMTLDEFEGWWILFKGKCGICGNDLIMPLKTRGQPLNAVAVDHDHKTGQVRGLLCNACNKGIGLFYDDYKRLENAVKYLKGRDK